MDTAKNDIGWAIRTIKQHLGTKVRRRGWHAKAEMARAMEERHDDD